MLLVINARHFLTKEVMVKMRTKRADIDNHNRRMHTRINYRMREELERSARGYGESYSDVIRAALGEWLARHRGIIVPGWHKIGLELIQIDDPKKD